GRRLGLGGGLLAPRGAGDGGERGKREERGAKHEGSGRAVHGRDSPTRSRGASTIRRRIRAPGGFLDPCGRRLYPAPVSDKPEEATGAAGGGGDRVFRAPKVTINRVYTRRGDGGQTRLVGGQLVPKDDGRIEAYGT